MKNKVVKVLIVLIMVLVAFSTPVLANGKEGECECPSDSEGGKITREPPHEERGEVSSDELEEIIDMLKGWSDVAVEQYEGVIEFVYKRIQDNSY